MTKWNRRLLKQDIRIDTSSIQMLKSAKRESGQPHWNGQDEWTLIKAKKAATIRCAIAAHLHNRIHLSNWQPPKSEEPRRPMTREEQWQFIEKHVAPYVEAEENAAAAV